MFCPVYKVKVTLEHARALACGRQGGGGWVIVSEGRSPYLFGIFRRYEVKSPGQGEYACCPVYKVKVTLDHVLTSRDAWRVMFARELSPRINP